MDNFKIALRNIRSFIGIVNALELRSHSVAKTTCLSWAALDSARRLLHYGVNGTKVCLVLGKIYQYRFDALDWGAEEAFILGQDLRMATDKIHTKFEIAGHFERFTTNIPQMVHALTKARRKQVCWVCTGIIATIIIMLQRAICTSTVDCLH